MTLVALVFVAGAAGIKRRGCVGNRRGGCGSNNEGFTCVVGMDRSTDGMVNATIRPQVQGYLLAQHYKEGDYVKKGQLLFEIDDQTFMVALKQANSRVVRRGLSGKMQRPWPVCQAPCRYKAVSAKDLDEAIRPRVLSGFS